MEKKLRIKSSIGFVGREREEPIIRISSAYPSKIFNNLKRLQLDSIKNNR